MADDFKLEDSSLIDVVDEHADRIRQQIVTVFPNFVVQKTQNAMALRFFSPDGVNRTNLEWIYFGYADDTPEMRKRRLRHLNLGGPAGFVSMEDGCVGGFVERGIADAEDASLDPADGRRRHREPVHARDRGRGPWFLVALAPDGRGMSLLLRLAELNAAYAAAIDQDRLEAWPDFFTDDCLYKITSAENHNRGYAAGIIYADSRAMLRDRVTALRTANIYERQQLPPYRRPSGYRLSGVTAETPFLVARIMRDGRTDLFATGVYRDVLVEDAGDLRFAERIVVVRAASSSTRCWRYRCKEPFP